MAILRYILGLPNKKKIPLIERVRRLQVTDVLQGPHVSYNAMINQRIHPGIAAVAAGWDPLPAITGSHEEISRVSQGEVGIISVAICKPENNRYNSDHSNYTFYTPEILTYHIGRMLRSLCNYNTFPQVVLPSSFLYRPRAHTAGEFRRICNRLDSQFLTGNEPPEGWDLFIRGIGLGRDCFHHNYPTVFDSFFPEHQLNKLLLVPQMDMLCDLLAAHSRIDMPATPESIKDCALKVVSERVKERDTGIITVDLV